MILETNAAIMILVGFNLWMNRGSTPLVRALKSTRSTTCWLLFYLFAQTLYLTLNKSGFCLGV